VNRDLPRVSRASDWRRGDPEEDRLGPPPPVIFRARAIEDVRYAMTMVARTLGAAVLGTLAGCTPAMVTLSPPALRATEARTIGAPRMTPTQGLFGGVAGPADEESVEITDPAVEIRDQVVQPLAKHYGLEVLEDGTTDLVLEIQTTSFTVAYGASYSLGVVPATVVLDYDGSLKLRDARTNEVLAEGSCNGRPVSGFDRKEREHAAETLLEEVRETVEYCSDQYRHRLLGLY